MLPYLSSLCWFEKWEVQALNFEDILFPLPRDSRHRLRFQDFLHLLTFLALIWKEIIQAPCPINN